MLEKPDSPCGHPGWRRCEGHFVRDKMGDPRTEDLRTAHGFGDYFRTIGEGSRYTPEQFRDFFTPLDPAQFEGKHVVELGFGHGSLLYHWGTYAPARLSGVDLGGTVDSVREKLSHLPSGMLDLREGDLLTADLGPHDLAYCIGVLHHLQDPRKGFEAVLRHTRPGGQFHCWVYSREGNFLVIYGVDVVRRLGNRLPWWGKKWISGFLLALPVFLYVKSFHLWPRPLAKLLPLHRYCLSVLERNFSFFHFLATDFLVARHTVYFDRATLESWLADPQIEPDSTYLIRPYGNAWKFGGRKKA